MITVKFLGGAKKSFSTDSLSLENDEFTIQDLLDYLLKQKPPKTPELDVNNILVAVNGVDSSAIQGKSTKLKPNDVVSIIPVIHGGSSRIQFRIERTQIELLEVNNNKLENEFLDNLRKKFPKLILQAVSINHILSKSHAKKIISISFAAKNNHALLSKKIETDILMRFACTTQISEAIKKLGIKPKKNFILIAMGSTRNLENLYNELKPILNSKPFSKNNDAFLKKEFHISKKQINCVQSKSPLEDILAEQAAILF